MLLHASTVAIDRKAVLLVGPPGSGKSDLALRLIDEGAELIADDHTEITRGANGLIASTPATIAGMIEVRHVGLLRMRYCDSADIALYVELGVVPNIVERLPENDNFLLLDYPVRRVRLPAFYASTPAKIRAALTHPRADG